MVERKAFFPNQSINIMHPNEANMIIMPLTKRMETITSIQVCIISWMNFDYKGSGGKKSFFCKSKALILCTLMWRTRLSCPITKRMEIITRIQVCLISLTNFAYKENGGKKTFSCKSTESISCITMWGT